MIHWQDFYVYELLLLFPVIDAQGADWSYSGKTGPGWWSQSFPLCGGSRQSPVHIDTANVWHTNSLTAFSMLAYETIPPQAHWGLINTGHMLKIELQGDYILEDGMLEGQYRAFEVRFHWGSDDKHGAEHMIDDYLAPMELQLFHYNIKYTSVQEAFMQEDGIAVLAFLFNISARDNLGYKHLLNHLLNVTYPGNQVTLRPLPLLTLLPANLNNYYRYHGSDTTPPCSESVIWSVFVNYVDISSRQLMALRRMLKAGRQGETDSARPLVDNYRPLQPLSGRAVYSSHPDHATVLSSPLSFPFSVTVAAFFGILLILVVMK